MKSGLEVGFALDRLWHALRGEMERSKKPALMALAKILEGESLPYAVIGGVALQVHQKEPRTTLDLDLAVESLERLPRPRLEAEGFRFRGRHAHSENWVGPDSIPVQFTDDPALSGGIRRADVVTIEDVTIRVISLEDLLHEKLRAGRDPARRRSKRLQDLADAESLLEFHPSLVTRLSPDERALLDRLPD